MSKSLAKIKAIEIIKTFSKEEKSEFKKFLASPYFNSNSNVTKLYNLILTNESKIYSDGITEKELYLRLFDPPHYSYSTMRNLMSSLFQMCEEFLIIHSTKYYAEYKFDNNIKLLKQYSNRYLDKNYHLKYSKIDKELDYKYLGYRYFEYKSKLNYSLSNFEWIRNNSEKRKEAMYNACINNICSIISTISEDIGILDYLRRIYNFEPKVKPAESLINNLDLKNLLEELKHLDDIAYNHICNEIRFINLILHQSDFENFYLLKKEILNNIHKYSNSEKFYHCTRLLAFAVNSMQKGNSKLILEISELRKFQLKKIKFGKDGVDSLTVRIFMDILDTFLNTETDEYVESFIKKNLNKVDAANRENALNYAMARLELKKSNFEKAIDHLSKLKLTEYLMKFQTKMLLIQAYYESGNYESGLYALDSLKHFMKNDKNLATQMKSKLNIPIGFIERIYKINNKPENYSLFDLDKLLNEVKSNYSSNVTWYEQKIEQLKKHYSGKRKLSRTA